MKKIAIITAPNMRFVNTGMTTVELSAKSFFESVAPDSKLDFYSIVPPNPSGPEKWMMMDLGHVHNSGRGIADLFDHKPIFDHIANLFSSDAIIYWGDFLQARHYLIAEGAGRLARLYGLNNQEAVHFAYRALLQADEPDLVKEKTIMFGGSLLYNTVHDYASDEYGKYIGELAQKCHCALMRDPISAIRVAHLRKDFTQSYLGIDPAFLLKNNDMRSLPTSAWSDDLESNGAVGLFFGTRTQPPKRLLPFCKELARRLDIRLEWLPWFPYHEKLRNDTKRPLWTTAGIEQRRWRQQIEDLFPRGFSYTQGDVLAALRKYRFIITDTYHLCINAWRAGVPAICFGSETDSSSHVIKDFKKRVLYEMYDAKDFYFDTSLLMTNVAEGEATRRICALLQDRAQLELIHARIRRHANSIHRILEKRVTEILN